MTIIPCGLVCGNPAGKDPLHAGTGRPAVAHALRCSAEAVDGTNMTPRELRIEMATARANVRVRPRLSIGGWQRLRLGPNTFGAKKGLAT
jgi:hypothetical protein